MDEFKVDRVVCLVCPKVLQILCSPAWHLGECRADGDAEGKEDDAEGKKEDRNGGRSRELRGRLRLKS